MAQNQSNPGWDFGYVPTPAQWAAAFSQKRDAWPPNILSGSSSLVLSGDYGYVGTANATFTLPLLSSLNSPFDIFNGSLSGAILTIACLDADTMFWLPAAITSTTLRPGQSSHIVNFTTFWALE